MMKDPLKKVLEIMEYLEVNREKVKESELVKRFGRDCFDLFSRYCIGHSPAFARQLGGVDPDQLTVLTPEGIRKMYELRSTLAEERRANWIKWATIVMAISAVVQLFKLFF